MSRRVVDNVVALKESHGFLRGLVALVGFPQTSVLYDRDPARPGSSKYNRFLGSLVIGLNGIVRLLALPAAADLAAGDDLRRVRLSARDRLLRGLKLGGLSVPCRQPDDRDRRRVLQRHPAPVARSDRRVRRAHLRRVARPAEVHHRVVAPRFDDELVSTSAVPPVCILAGGLGTRLGDRVRETPKPLLRVAGPAVLSAPAAPARPRRRGGRALRRLSGRGHRGAHRPRTVWCPSRLQLRRSG